MNRKKTKANKIRIKNFYRLRKLKPENKITFFCDNGIPEFSIEEMLKKGYRFPKLS